LHQFITDIFGIVGLTAFFSKGKYPSGDNDSKICRTTESEDYISSQNSHYNNELVRAHPLPDGITNTGKEQFIALFSHYSELILRI